MKSILLIAIGSWIWMTGCTLVSPNSDVAMNETDLLRAPANSKVTFRCYPQKIRSFHFAGQTYELKIDENGGGSLKSSTNGVLVKDGLALTDFKGQVAYANFHSPDQKTHLVILTWTNRVGLGRLDLPNDEVIPLDCDSTIGR